ncbi:hypothetical protein FOMPIDRAFT_1081467, partial [Fomitopsis schrenkii]
PTNLPTSFSADSLPRPMPAHECSVHPPMFTAAIPVAAVIARRPEYRSPRFRIIS